MQYLDGGSAYHCNLQEYPTQEGFRKLLQVAAKEGCEYFCFNIKVTCCNDCGFIDKHTLTECSKCHSKNIDYATRIIGYLTKISSWSKERREEHKRRAYGKVNNDGHSICLDKDKEHCNTDACNNNNTNENDK